MPGAKQETRMAWSPAMRELHKQYHKHGDEAKRCEESYQEWLYERVADPGDVHFCDLFTPEQNLQGSERAKKFARLASQYVI
jgi:hypothetical protein